MAPRRRSTDVHSAIVGWIKATVGFVTCGAIAFVGTWAVDLGTSVARINEEVQVLKEKEQMVTNMIYPNLMEQIKQLREEMKDIRHDMKDIHQDIKSIRRR